MNGKNTNINEFSDGLGGGIRQDWIDIAKCFGILLVLIAHALPRYTFIWNAINQFHMPLFYVLAGITYKTESTFLTFFKKKIKNIWLPYVLCCLVAIIFDRICSLYPYWDETIVRVKDIIKYCLLIETGPLLGAMWFMGVLFYSLILTYIIQRIELKFCAKRNVVRGIDLGIALFFLVLGLYIKFPYRFSNVLVAYFYIYIGKLFSHMRRENDQIISIVSVAFGIFSLFGLLIVSLYSTVSVSMNTFSNRGLFIISSLLGCNFTIVISKFIKKLKYTKLVLCFVGEKTYGIVAFQFWAFKAVTFVQVLLYELKQDRINDFPIIYELTLQGWIIAYIVAGIVISIVLYEPIHFICVKTIEIIDFADMKKK